VTPAEAWAAVVAGEDAAIYAYQVAGGRVAASDRRAARAGLDAHRQRRTRAAALLEQAGGEQPAGDSSYALPDSVARPRGARRLMADVDLALVPVYADAAGAAQGDDRRWAARAAADCATSAMAWGASAQAFPAGPTAYAFPAGPTA